MKNRPYILSVEDNPNDVVLMNRVFEKYISSHDAIFLPDVEVAQRFIYEKYEENDLPHLILLDIKLTKSNGLDFLSFVKSDKRYKQIPVVMLTSSDREDDKTVAREKGCDQYLEKPRKYEVLNRKLPEIVKFWTEKQSNDKRGI